MELKGVIGFVIILAVFTLIVTLLKMRNTNKIGFVFTYFNKDYNYKVGVLKVDGSKVFGIIVENNCSTDVVLTNIYIEIKENNKFRKYILPNDVFDSTKQMIIPPNKVGAAFMEVKQFKKIFKSDSQFRTVVENSNGNKYKSTILKVSGKNKDIK
jgi:hypothetical protein